MQGAAAPKAAGTTLRPGPPRKGPLLPNGNAAARPLPTPVVPVVAKPVPQLRPVLQSPNRTNTMVVEAVVRVNVRVCG